MGIYNQTYVSKKEKDRAIKAFSRKHMSTIFNHDLIIKHLAEKVCGWKKETVDATSVDATSVDATRSDSWEIWRHVSTNNYWTPVKSFNPITNISDCLVVVDAWRKQVKGILEISVTDDLVEVEARCGKALGYVSDSELSKALSYAIWMCSLGVPRDGEREG